MIAIAPSNQASLGRVTTDEILRPYAMGERNFVNANLRCAVLASAKLSEINLSYAQCNLSLRVSNAAKCAITTVANRLRLCIKSNASSVAP